MSQQPATPSSGGPGGPSGTPATTESGTLTGQSRFLALGAAALVVVIWILGFFDDFTFTATLPGALIIGGGLLAGTTLLPKAARVLPVAVVLLLTGALLLLQYVSDGGTGAVAVVGTVLSFLAVVLAAGALLMDLGIITGPAPRPQGYGGQGHGPQGQGGYRPGYGQQAQGGYGGAPQGGYGQQSGQYAQPGYPGQPGAPTGYGQPGGYGGGATGQTGQQPAYPGYSGGYQQPAARPGEQPAGSNDVTASVSLPSVAPSAPTSVGHQLPSTPPSEGEVPAWRTGAPESSGSSAIDPGSATSSTSEFGAVTPKSPGARPVEANPASDVFTPPSGEGRVEGPGRHQAPSEAATSIFQKGDPPSSEK